MTAVLPCFGVACNRHGRCARYMEVESGAIAIGTCVAPDGSYPQFQPIPRLRPPFEGLTGEHITDVVRAWCGWPSMEQST